MKIIKYILFILLLSQISGTGAAISWTEDFSSSALSDWEYTDGNFTVNNGILGINETSNLWHNQTGAFGTWQFVMRILDTSWASTIYFISTGSNYSIDRSYPNRGYSLTWYRQTQQFFLMYYADKKSSPVEFVSPGFVTGDPGDWHTYTIIRDKDANFDVQIDGTSVFKKQHLGLLEGESLMINANKGLEIDIISYLGLDVNTNDISGISSDNPSSSSSSSTSSSTSDYTTITDANDQVLTIATQPASFVGFSFAFIAIAIFMRKKR